MGRGDGSTQTFDFADVERAGLRDTGLDPRGGRQLDVWVFTGLTAPMGDNEAKDVVECFRKRKAGRDWARMDGISVVDTWTFEIFYRAASQEEAERQILDRLIEMNMNEMLDSWQLHEQGS